LRAHYQAELLLSRHGVLTRGAVATEGVPGGFATLYKVLSTFEEAGRCQRGYFVESLGGAQFAVSSTVDRLRSYTDGIDPERPEYRAVVLAAADPANPYGAALPWPTPEGARPGRKAGALVVLVDGELAWFLERGGRSLLTFTDDPAAHHSAAVALADLVAAGRVASILVERIDGLPALQPQAGGPSPVTDALSEAGFMRTPRGMRLPEGDTVWHTAVTLRQNLAGLTLTRCDVRVPQFATVDLTGQVVDEVFSRGKHLFIRIGPASIHSHLKMDGSWRVGNRPIRVDHRARIVLEAGAIRAVGVDLGVLEIRIGTPGRPPRTWPPSRTGRSLRRCWTSGCWPGSAMSIAMNCVSSQGICPARR
jgi:hypothetical protein